MANKPKKSADPAKKPNRTGRAITVWISDRHADALDAFLASHRLKPKITDTIELALEDFLKNEGFWPADKKS